jgi:hypothetical protein
MSNIEIARFANIGALKEDSFVLLLHSSFAAINTMCLRTMNFLITFYGTCTTRAYAAKVSI